MAITFVAESHSPGYGSAYAGSVTINKPTGTAQDDLMIMFVAGTASSTPSGWTRLGSAVNTGSSSMGFFQIYYNIAGASEPSSYTVSLTGTWWSNTAVIATYRGCDLTTPVDTTNFAISSVSSTTNFNTASVTADGTQWAISCAGDYIFSGSSHSYTGGSGTERLDFTTSTADPATAAFAFYDSNGAVSAGSFSRTQTNSQTTSNGIRAILLLNPANTQTNVSGTETGSGADIASVTATRPASDTGASAETAVAGVPKSAADTGAGADTAHAVAQAPDADTGSGIDAATVRLNVAVTTDTGTGTDSAVMAIVKRDGESASIVDNNATLFFPQPTPPAVETGTALESSPLAIRQIQETGTLADTAHVFNLWILGDAGTGADSATMTIVVPGRPQLRVARVQSDVRVYTVIPVTGGG